VLKWTPGLADPVLAGTKPLNEAYEEAKLMRDRAEALPARMERLRKEAPDLADIVEEGRLSINEAVAASDRRRTDARIRRQGPWDFFDRLERDIVLVEAPAQINETVTVLAHFAKECRTKRPPMEIVDIWIQGLQNIKERING